MESSDFIRSLFRNLSQRSNDQQVVSIHIALGEFVDDTEATIRHEWQELSKGTFLEQARLHFRFIHAEVQCMACFEKYHPLDKKIHCPYCGSYGAKILTGEEFRLDSIELDTQ